MKWGLAKRNDVIDSSIDSFKKDFDKMFDNFFSLRPSSLLESNWFPNVDVTDEGALFSVKADLPGLNEKDINVTVDNGMLTISGEKKYENREESKDKCRIITERRFGSFSRVIQIPGTIKSDKIKANFKNGVLSIEIPKEEPSVSNKINIEVK